MVTWQVRGDAGCEVPRRLHQEPLRRPHVYHAGAGWRVRSRCGPRAGHVLVTCWSRAGHVLVTWGSRAGHMGVTSWVAWGA
eukprot:5753979-Prymnesium_polylepis.2